MSTATMLGITSRGKLVRFATVEVTESPDLDALSARFEMCTPAPRGRHHRTEPASVPQRTRERVTDQWL